MDCQAIILKTYEYVKDVSLCNDLSHDFLHVQRVVALTKKIAKTHSDCDMFVAEMVALLHDVEDRKLGSKKFFKVKDFLNHVGLSSETACKIMQCIGFISYSKNPTKNEALPIEAKIVQDADRIDAIGAVGVARTFAYGATQNYPFYDNDEKTHSTLEHFEEKLFKLYDLLNTNEAKRIALKRHEFMKQFYLQFLDEIK